MKNKLILSISILFALIFNACENLNDPGEIEYHNSAFITLKTGSQKQQFFVYNSRPMKYDFGDSSQGAPYDVLEDCFSNNAKIQISSDNIQYDKFQVERRDTQNYYKYYTNTTELLIQPNRKYAVRIESGNNVMTGEVVTVGSFQILDISRKDLTSNGYYVRWSKADNARYYRVKVLSFYKEYLPPQVLKGVIEENYFLDPDTVKCNNIFEQVVKLQGGYDSVKIAIEACDINLYNYYYKKVKRSNINNAYGFFGSAAVMEERVY